MSEEVAASIGDVLAENARLKQQLAQVQADYALLRGAVRLIFGDSATDQHMIDLWNMVTTIEHPGAVINIRYNRMKAQLDGFYSVVRQALAARADGRAMDMHAALDALAELREA